MVIQDIWDIPFRKLKSLKMYEKCRCEYTNKSEYPMNNRGLVKEKPAVDIVRDFQVQDNERTNFSQNSEKE